MADLKPCPFCESAEVGQWKEGSCVVCYTCGAEGPMTADHSLSHLAPEEAWNRRTPDPRDEVIRGLVEAVGEIARQRLSNEMTKGEADAADWEGGYDMCIGVARAALAAARKMMGGDNG